MPNPITTIIEVRDLIYDYPGARALDGVSFEVSGGSITALVGPNGAGKTTLLRCLAGMDRPLTGQIYVGGIDVIDEPRRSHREIGYLPDFFGLYPDLTVRQNLTYVATANGIPQRRVAALVEQTASELVLTDRLDQRAGALSRGLGQRAAIAQAVIHGPGVVLLDEPASGLDPEARYQLGELFIALRRRGMTLLVSSHILAELEAYSTDMLVLRAGRIVEHRRLQADVNRDCRVQIATTTPLQPVLDRLGKDPRTSDLEHINDTVVFNFAGSAEERAALLASLVADGVGVAHFAVLAEDLQRSYLRTISKTEVAS